MDDFVGVVGVVVGNEEGLAQNSLARAVRNSGQQVGFVIVRQVNGALAVGVDVVQRGLPLLRVGGGVPGGPVPAGHSGDSCASPGEKPQDVPLRNVEVLHQLPDGVGCLRHVLVPDFGRKAGAGVL